jgi:hypothetical protein
MRTRTSFQKRQKEIARAEKQRDKAAKRLQKKLMAKQSPGSGSGPDEQEETADAESEPPPGPESIA